MIIYDVVNKLIRNEAVPETMQREMRLESERGLLERIDRNLDAHLRDKNTPHVGEFMYIGDDDGRYGLLKLYGDNTGVDNGGEVRFHTSADNDTVIEYYTIRASQDDLYIEDASAQNKMRFVGVGFGIEFTANSGGNFDFSVGDSGVTPTAGADTIFIEANGNAGITIGTTTTGTGAIYFTDTGGDQGQIYYDHNTDKMVIKANGVSVLEFTTSTMVFNEAANDIDIRFEGTSQTNLFLINAGANTLNSTSSANTTIFNLVNTHQSADGIAIDLGDGTNNLTVANDFMIFRDRVGTTVVGTIDSDGAGGTRYNVSSDRRLKSKILPMHSALERLMKLKPSQYEMFGKQREGLIAQEVDEVYPQAVSRPTKGNEYYMLDYSKFVPLIIGAIQELYNERRP